MGCKVSKPEEEYQYWLSKVEKGYPYRVQLHDAPDHILCNKKFVMEAVNINGLALIFASPELKSDKHVVLGAVQQRGRALEYASPELQSNKDFVMAAVQKDRSGEALKYASPGLRNDKDVVMAAIQSEWDSFLHHLDRNTAPVSQALCSSKLRYDKEFILMVVQKYGLLLYHLPKFRNDKEVVIASVKQNAGAFHYASKELQNDKDVCKAYVKGYPSNIRNIPDTYKTDPEILIAAGQFHQDHFNRDARKVKGTKKIVLSTRFSFIKTSYSEATIFAALISCHPYIQEGNFEVYTPNANDKKTCDVNWTDFNHPCRGTTDTCQMKDIKFRTGTPTDESCWRYSFRNQLEEAATTNGFMLQLVESPKNRYPGQFEEQTLGNGQAIELDMAKNHLKMKIFQVYRPVVKGGSYEAIFFDSHIEQVVTAIKRWYDEGCRDMDICVIKFNFDLLDMVANHCMC